MQSPDISLAASLREFNAIILVSIMGRDESTVLFEFLTQVVPTLLE
jgi:hypothetical protein